MQIKSVVNVSKFVVIYYHHLEVTSKYVPINVTSIYVCNEKKKEGSEQTFRQDLIALKPIVVWGIQAQRMGGGDEEGNCDPYRGRSPIHFFNRQSCGSASKDISDFCISHCCHRKTKNINQ